jgi:hypothetical protein
MMVGCVTEAGGLRIITCSLLGLGLAEVHAQLLQEHRAVPVHVCVPAGQRAISVTRQRLEGTWGVGGGKGGLP